MSFLWPAGLALAGLLPLIVILYFLKLRRQPKVVSSTYLWKRTVDEYRVNRPFQRFQNQLLLWLQLLLLSALILGASRPYVRAEEEHSGIKIVLVDHSASMNTRESGGTRLDLAKKLVGEMIRSKRRSDQMMILAFSDRSFVAAPLTVEKDPLLKALDEIPATNRPTRLAEAWRAAISVAREFDRSDIYLVSDGGFGKLEAVTQANAVVHYVPIGKSVNNLGIVHLEARPASDDKSVREIFARLFNRRDEPATTQVELHLNDRLVDAQRVVLGPGETKGVVFRRRVQDEGIAEVRIPEEDDFAADNRAWVPLRTGEPAKVLLVGEENLFLQQVLLNDPDVELTMLTPAAYAPLEGRLPASDLVVFDRIAPKVLPRGTTLCLGAVPEMEGFSAAAAVENPKLIKWESEHPLTQYVNFSNLNVSKLIPGEQPAWMRLLLVSDKGPVLVAGERGGSRLALMRFALLDSDWPLRISFPLFVSNLVRWAKDVDVTGTEAIVRSGEPLTVSVPAGAREGTLFLPDGREQRLSPGGERRMVLADTERPGVYRIRWDGQNRDALYVVNLLDPAESDIRVPEAVTLGGSQLLGKDERALVQRELTKYLLFGAVALLLLEWGVYQFVRGH